MKDSLIDNQLRLHKLEMISDSIDDAVASDMPTMYDFEITNMAESELNPSAKDDKKNAADANSGASKMPNQQRRLTIWSLLILAGNVIIRII